jgi:Carboxypeptidase regulatory-like domain
LNSRHGLVLCLLCIFPRLALAQGSASVVIALRVVDSASAPVPGADVSIVRGVSSVLAHAATDAAGNARLALPAGEKNLQLVARRIGYQPLYRFFDAPAADSTTMSVTLSRTVATLAPVNVTASEDLKRKSYHLDAEDIENTDRAMLDATDLFKLRPDMMTSRGGAQSCAVPWTDHDGWIENVWVNGRRVALPVVDSQYVAGRKPALGIENPPPRPNPTLSRSGQSRPTQPAFTQFSHIDTVLSILHSIKPEHIAEITYHDCFDTSIGKPHDSMAMFIVLKPGIAYDEGAGSYVVAERPRRILSELDTLPRYRFRLVGIFDGATGDPLPNVDVIDTLTGTSAKTTATGTVSLFFVPAGARPLRLHLAGYRDTTLTVTISPADTIAMTLILSRPPAP